MIALPFIASPGDIVQTRVHSEARIGGRRCEGPLCCCSLVGDTGVGDTGLGRAGGWVTRVGGC